MNSNRYRSRILPTLLVGALAVAACGSDDDSSTSTEAPAATTADSESEDTAAPATDDTASPATEDTAAPDTEPDEPYEGEIGVTDDTIKIGFFLPETGPYSVVTTDLGNKVTQVAFDEVNAAGGIHGRQLEMVFYDDGSGDPAVTQASFKDAEEEIFGAMAIIGNTATTLGALGEIAEVPSVVGNIDGRVARESMWTFGAIPYWDTSSRLMDDYILSTAGTDTPVGVVFMASPNGEGAHEAFMEEAEASGLNIVVEQPIDPFPATCSNEIGRLADAGAEVVYMITASIPAICIHRAAVDGGYNPTAWLSPGYGWSLSFVAEAAGGLPESVTAFGHTTSLETEAGQYYEEQVKKFVPEATKDDYSVDSILSYAMAQILIEGLKAAGPELTRVGFREAMETDVSGVDTGFSPPPVYAPGDRSGPVSVSLWEPGTWLVDGVETPTWVTKDPTWYDGF